ncbi:cilia- and flagella-associated protein 97 [Pleuronectes platessa]|uniref:cilia- and flagella-associated protein 97 n=1 Tax=Pleuronectes platessa TaxID=8262 RepID=UPI00232A4C76|nr:cilia- and flagella-associated protein 97 [Pleuronectes platessa]XP_053275510.1 cilia- and flagella-associated protein 97 [Pleuronectes platessa]XP_053275511.1 cilia- and flagella-associated protein 97 [Pleuronectes platessa]
MLTSSEVEDEVDHSFFDSDADDGSVSREGRETTEIAPVKEKLPAKQTEKANSGLSQRTYGTKKHRQKVNSNGSSGESKKNSSLSKEESKRRVSNLSPAASMSDKGISSDSSDGEEDYKVLSKRPTKTSMALLDEVNERDIYNQSPDETEEEAGSTSKHSKWRDTQASKKPTRKLRSQIPSSSSTEDSESSSSCSCRRSPIPHKPKKSSLSPREGRSTQGGAGSQDMTTSCTEESDDTVTNVSPLSSPDITPLQSLNLNHTEAEERSPTEPQQESVPSSGLSETPQYEDSECSFISDSQLGGGPAASYPGRKNRKNFSFNNNDVQRIDQENQRLFRVLSRLSAEPGPESAAKKKTKRAGHSPAMHVHHSAVNRRRDQKRIETENLAFLKRLESAKPSYGMKRSEQEKDYQRLASYYGGPVYPLSRKDRSSFELNSVGPRSASSTRHSSRAVSTTTDSGSTPAPTSQKRCSYSSRFQT